MFPDRLTLFSHPAILIMLAVMTAMFILEFVFRKRFFIIVNPNFNIGTSWLSRPCYRNFRLSVFQSSINLLIYVI